MTEGGDQTRERLVAAARELYLRDGPERFSLREVARQVGLSPAAVYRHFADKETLLRAVCLTGFETFRTYLMRALGAKTPRARLDAASEGYLRFALENPLDYRVIFTGSVLEPIGDPGETFQFLVDRVRECIEARVLAKGDPVLVATSIWAHVHGLCSLRLSGHLSTLGDDEAFARFYHHSTESLISGLNPK
jgi:AcrR family transcriptional regulator